MTLLDSQKSSLAPQFESINSSVFPGGSEVKVSARNVGDLGLIHGLGRIPGEGNSDPLQYSCLGNPMDRGAWWAAVHGVTKSRTRLSDFTYLLTYLLKIFLQQKQTNKREPLTKEKDNALNGRKYMQTK